MARRIRLLIDGCGALTSETILPHLVQPDFREIAEVVAVADIVPERAQAAKNEFGLGASFGDADEMLESVEADAMLVILPHALHAAHALKAIRRGLHVYVQKPFAPDVATGETVIAEAAANGVKLVAAPGQALWPLYDELRWVIAQGEIGPVYFAVPPMLGWGSHEVRFPNNPAWFFSDQGGPLRDHGGYGIQTLTTLFGPVRRVTGFSGTVTPDRIWNGEAFAVTGHDNTCAVLEFDQAIHALLAECWCDSAPAARYLRVHGLMGAIECSAESANELTIFPYGAKIHRMRKEPLLLAVDLSKTPCMANDHARFGHVHVYSDILHLVTCIREDTPVRATAQQALHTVDVMNSIFRAAATGQTQAIGTTFAQPSVPTLDS